MCKNYFTFQTFFMNMFYKATNYFSAGPKCDFHLFPTVSLWTFDFVKQMHCADIHTLWNIRQVLVWSCFRSFPSVSKGFPFCDRPSGQIQFRKLIQCKPVPTMMLRSFHPTCVRLHCTKYCILTWISKSNIKKFDTLNAIFFRNFQCLEYI